jgi:hypothetical protein
VARYYLDMAEYITGDSLVVRRDFANLSRQVKTQILDVLNKHKKSTWYTNRVEAVNVYFSGVEPLCFSDNKEAAADIDEDVMEQLCSKNPFFEHNMREVWEC